MKIANYLLKCEAAPHPVYPHYFPKINADPRTACQCGSSGSSSGGGGRGAAFRVNNPRVNDWCEAGGQRAGRGDVARGVPRNALLGSVPASRPARPLPLGGLTPHPLSPSRAETGVRTQFPKGFLSLWRQEPGTDFLTLIACTRKERGRGGGSGGGKG